MIRVRGPWRWVAHFAGLLAILVALVAVHWIAAIVVAIVWEFFFLGLPNVHGWGGGDFDADGGGDGGGGD